MRPNHLIASLTLVTLGQTALAQTPQNIILIMCDDMGFSDISCYGGEIKTPNIDLLAKNGVRFSNFKNAGRSCPSRASLLTGKYQHEVGMGWMTAVDEKRPGYRGEITKDIPTIAEILKSNGYHTYMSGKWHLTVETAFSKPNGSYPTQRGFDTYYGCLSGGGSYYIPKPVYSNLTPITKFPDDYYYTTAITDTAVHFIKQHTSNSPMFMYIAHYAPHKPLQAPAKRVMQCKERYKVGYDILRTKRFEQLKSLGFINKKEELPIFQREFNKKRPLWQDLTPEQQEQWITEMATYAAMIEIMDEGIGKVIQATKDKGIFENTVFLFLSDNGSTNEGDIITQLRADLNNTPYRSYKQWCFNGGTSSPLIISYGKEQTPENKGKICRTPSHIIDILPTCLDIASAAYPKKFKDKPIKELEGRSIISMMKKKKLPARKLYFEHQTSSAIISDYWKLVRYDGKQPWVLINLSKDPFEQTDISDAYPEKVKELALEWEQWAERVNVYPFEYRPWTKRINYYKNKEK